MMENINQFDKAAPNPADIAANIIFWGFEAIKKPVTKGARNLKEKSIPAIKKLR